MTRRKATALIAPETMSQATAMIYTYALLSASVAAIEAERAIRRAEIDKECDERIATRTEDMRGIFAALQAWWAVAGNEVAKGKRSTEIGPVSIGVRKTPSALKMKGTAKANIATLLKVGLGRFLKVKHSIDKDAIKRVLGLAEPDGDTLLDQKDLTALGFSVGSKDEFFIAPLAERDRDVETVS